MNDTFRIDELDAIHAFNRWQSGESILDGIQFFIGNDERWKNVEVPGFLNCIDAALSHTTYPGPSILISITM